MNKRELENKIEDLEGPEPEDEEVRITVGSIPEDADPEDSPDPIHLELET
ncbi:MAG: hypothetical protein ACLFUR_05330 [Candidatus Hadarchaeia archaeon]